jgi:hypothetical protein
MHGAGLADEVGSELLEHSCGGDERAPEAVHGGGVAVGSSANARAGVSTETGRISVDAPSSSSRFITSA